ncbi:Leucine rich repeat N-terminal domain [Musa troglodytarum]|uniref:Leucine rich repeat N-terminal domain n=1 Tax=Musa troglodytarum TaxID=320322 RepID=A0A9E7K3Y1_9LILI|nr:Leucine rich repeat N-terminal domain [Musa troglodytarum]
MASQLHKTLLCATLLLLLLLPRALLVKASLGSQGRALLHWKDTLRSPQSLRSWNLNSSPCNWTGVTCNYPVTGKGRSVITEISLPNMGLAGPLDALDFSALGSLLRLNLYYNQLGGTIPPAISALSRLVSLDLTSNQFTSKIPVGMGSMKDIQFLSLSQNQMVGAIPPPLSNLTKLMSLYLDDNNLMGVIPKELREAPRVDVSGSWGRLSRLTDLALYNNQLSGALPVEINNITGLTYLELGNKSFFGYVPPNICKGGALKYLTLYMNFQGPIPLTLKNCTTLKRVRLERNQLTGDVSQYLGEYPYLSYMDLSFNLLSGTLSPDLSKLHNLARLRISNNITGVIPTEFGQLTKLQDLDLSSNYLQGEIPQSFGSLTLLYNLSLGNNQLVGQVPPEFGMLSNLELLDLSSNNLAGRIPDQLGNCMKLRSLKLNNNSFSGTIPLAIGNLAVHQDTFDVSHNSLTGDSIPTQRIGDAAKPESIA